MPPLAATGALETALRVEPLAEVFADNLPAPFVFFAFALTGIFESATCEVCVFLAAVIFLPATNFFAGFDALRTVFFAEDGFIVLPEVFVEALGSRFKCSHGAC